MIFSENFSNFMENITLQVNIYIEYLEHLNEIVLTAHARWIGYFFFFQNLVAKNVPGNLYKEAIRIS